MDLLDSIREDDTLDYYWTHRSLGDVQSIVARLRALRPIVVAQLPETRVQYYMEQASMAYVYGLFDACTILCRACLEFALKERANPTATLDWLIDEAARTHLIDSRSRQQAERVQRRGNEAVHRHACDQADALTQVRETSELLHQLYVA
jgi:hypothetical protein